jgi:uncharacterized membrane protein
MGLLQSERSFLMRKMSTKQLVQSGLIAALYIVLTVSPVLATISYGQVQFRVSEALVLLSFFSPVYIPAVAVGTFIANLVGPFGIIDAVVGSAASALAMILIWQTRKLMGTKLVSLFLASLWPVLVNALYVPALIIMVDPDTPWQAFAAIGVSVAIGEFVVVSLVGVALWYSLKNHPLLNELNTF